MSEFSTAERQYQTALIECTKQFGQTEKYLQHLKGQIRILEAENEFLAAQNAEYARKLSLIMNNPFSKAGIKLYHFLGKLGNRM